MFVFLNGHRVSRLTVRGRFPASVIAAVLTLMLILAACGGDDDETPVATPTEEAVAAATATATPEPTPTETPTPEPTPTATPYQPAPTVAAPLYQPPAPPAAPTREPEPEPEPEPEDPGQVEEDPEPPPESDIPDDNPEEDPDVGELLLANDLTGFITQENELGYGFATEDGYHVVLDGDTSGREYWDLSYAGEQFTNIIVSIDVRFVGGGPSSFACLAARTAPTGWDNAYVLCITGFNETFADYKWVDEEGLYYYEALTSFGVREATRQVGEWNTLTIVTRGQDLGFFINDELIDIVPHPAIEVGGVAFLAGNWDENPPEWAFTNLEVWAFD